MAFYQPQGNYQQPSFKFITNIASYDCKLQQHIEGQEKWIVDVVYVSSETVIATFELPASWSREIVFGFLSRMEIS